MNRQVMWTAREWPGCEHLDLRFSAGQIIADGVILAALKGRPIRLAYRIEADPSWRTKSLAVDVHGHHRRTLTHDEHGDWFENGSARPDLTNCTDVDISLTPFTNTLPIRRLDLAVGATAQIRAIYLRFTPELDFTVSKQRYTRLETGYRYESEGFRADLDVDHDGLVINYPHLWAME
ncbi:putative glycolipid-binding domain-containing protein [Natronoglycomyces albus]|uniref:Putative glycolipid-binding domain-containing protein n=1 Tax=Natronoglycomyces albus TaxID=2811108 RepID=A0A895XRR1_9ACTN|nr:putative glycolipid-binding domain-containing protein [Natronoglycomyces albus]QSB04940.1 putative glycolipid-binding domain-containing protein [Natronoglycomyces albus]